jgi:hypothetical protein
VPLVGPLAIAAGFAGLLLTIGAGSLAAVTASVLLVGGGIGAAWAHIGSMVLAAARRGEEDVTASLIPSTQTVAVAMGAALCGVVANAAGLSGGATPSSTAAAARLLFGAFIAVPLTAAVIAARMRAAGR